MNQPPSGGYIGMVFPVADSEMGVELVTVAILADQPGLDVQR